MFSLCTLSVCFLTKYLDYRKEHLSASFLSAPFKTSWRETGSGRCQTRGRTPKKKKREADGEEAVSGCFLLTEQIDDGEEQKNKQYLR